MVVGGGQQETLNPGFVLLGTRQQGVPVILRELVLPGGFDPINDLTKQIVRRMWRRFVAQVNDFDGVLSSELNGLVVEVS
ncbi:unnamed protein product [Schistosoma margrebowiei]|uniref:Uncharacterized protein n=1 Tax=Schistosoma margrebowiei TaxID=48269 RepID=A0A183LL56_9TREM|nr:unnamed protein product [Schistosoma margrebowiei]